MTFTEPYVIVDEFGVKNANDELSSGIFYEVKNELALPNLNYQYGYTRELNETLKQYAENDEFMFKKFPLVWLQQPFTIIKDVTAITYGTIEFLRLFICVGTDVNYKAKDRMAKSFKPIIYPIYGSIMNQIDLSRTFVTQSADQIAHTISDRYFWGPDEAIFGDKIDCSVITLSGLVVSNKTCLPFKSF